MLCKYQLPVHPCSFKHYLTYLNYPHSFSLIAACIFWACPHCFFHIFLSMYTLSWADLINLQILFCVASWQTVLTYLYIVGKSIISRVLLQALSFINHHFHPNSCTFFCTEISFGTNYCQIYTSFLYTLLLINMHLYLNLLAITIIHVYGLSLAIVLL